MVIAKRWAIVLEPLCQIVVAINLGMALQRWDDGRVSYFTVIAILMSAAGLVLLVTAQIKRKLAEAQNGHMGSPP